MKKMYLEIETIPASGSELNKLKDLYESKKKKYEGFGKKYGPSMLVHWPVRRSCITGNNFAPSVQKLRSEGGTSPVQPLLFKPESEVPPG